MVNKIIRKTVIWITISMLCIFSCWGLYTWLFIPRFAYIPKTSGIGPVWVDKLLHSPTCELPCWENLSPGMTHLTEGRNLLEQVPGVEITNASFQKGVNVYHTEWLMDSGSNTNDVGWVNARSQDGIIYNIILGLNADSYMPLGDFIDIYGQPEYLQAYNCVGFLCIFRLVYPILARRSS